MKESIFKNFVIKMIFFSNSPFFSFKLTFQNFFSHFILLYMYDSYEWINMNLQWYQFQWYPLLLFLFFYCQVHQDINHMCVCWGYMCVWQTNTGHHGHIEQERERERVQLNRKAKKKINKQKSKMKIIHI